MIQAGNSPINNENKPTPKQPSLPTIQQVNDGVAYAQQMRSRAGVNFQYNDRTIPVPPPPGTNQNRNPITPTPQPIPRIEAGTGGIIRTRGMIISRGIIQLIRDRDRSR